MSLLPSATPCEPRTRDHETRAPRVRAATPVRFAGIAAMFLAAPAARAADGLQITPTGFAEAFAEHGLLALLPQHMPQFWALILLFGVLSILLNRFAFSPLLEVIEERDRRIAGAREKAAEIAAQAEQLLGRHSEALREVREREQTERQAVLERARGTAQSHLDEARRDAEQSTLEARRDVDSALAQARGALRGDAEDVAQTIAERLLGGNT